MQRYAVWFGGSIIGNTPEFAKSVKTKAGEFFHENHNLFNSTYYIKEYEEYGPSICRPNPVFGDMF